MKCDECEKTAVAKRRCPTHYQALRRVEKGLVAARREARDPDAKRVPVWFPPDEDAALRKAVPARGLNSFIRAAVRLKLAADAAEAKAARRRTP